MELAEDRLREIIREELQAHLSEQAVPVDGRLLTSKELAELLQCSPQRVSELARQGEIAALRLGKRWRFRLSEVRESLKPEPVDPWARRSRRDLPAPR